MTFPCLCHYESARFAELQPGTHLGDRFGRGGIDVRPIDFIERP
jgi:hypothetical protein